MHRIIAQEKKKEAVSLEDVVLDLDDIPDGVAGSGRGGIRVGDGVSCQGAVHAGMWDRWDNRDSVWDTCGHRGREPFILDSMKIWFL